MPKPDVPGNRVDPRILRRLPRKRGRKDEGGEPIPADPGPRPLPLEGGAEAPLD
jgi:hypothetical protein